MICTTNCTLTTARIDAKSKFNTIFFKKGIENAEICSIIVVWGITTMNNYEFLEKLGFSSNEAKVYGFTGDLCIRIKETSTGAKRGTADYQMDAVSGCRE